MFCDNEAVVKNTSRPHSVLRKKQHSICYHAVREAVTMDEIQVHHIRSEQNPSDICTKIIYGGLLRRTLVRMLLYDIFDFDDL